MQTSLKSQLQNWFIPFIVFYIASIDCETHKPPRISIGDANSVVLGGLFPVHTKGPNEDEPCGMILPEKGIQRLEAMLYAIDQVNRNKSYWKFRLGATIVDTCSSDSYALEESLYFLQSTVGYSCASSKKVKAVVGAANSAISASVANIFRLFKIPQVSYASTSQDLDDLHKYPYFFRVVPSDKFQVRVILDILLEFQWTFVSVVASKGEYGESAVQNLMSLIRNSTQNDICFAAVEIIPRDATEDDYDTVIRHLLLQEKAKVVIVFLNEDKISELLDASDRCEIEETRFLWLGSDGWGAKERVVWGNEKLAEGAITILPKRFAIKGFDEYFTSLTPESNIRNPWFREFWETTFLCSFNVSGNSPISKCTGDEDLTPVYRQEGLVPMVIDSVYLLATAIRTLCGEHPKFCYNPMDTALQYKKKLKEIIANTTLESSQGNDMVISFDAARSIPVNYTIYQYQRFGDKYRYNPIGEWNPSKRLRLLEDPVWYTTDSFAHDESRKPVSRCSEECNVGEERLLNHELHRRCCWSCRPCEDIYYLPNPHSPCTPCPQGLVPRSDKTSCIELEPEYLGQDLRSPWPLVPLVFSIFGLICTTIVFVIFFLHHKTPIIMASGRELCYIILVGIVFCYCFTFVVLMKPTKISCGVLRVGMGLGLSVCYSAIFTKTNRLSRIFEVSLRITKRPSYISPESQIIICMCLILIQITLTVLWLIIKPPIVVQRLLQSPRMWVIVCGFDAISVLLGLLYNMILLILCTVYAYKTRNIPENFNETKCICFTMYSSCIVWLAFIPIYFSALQDYKVQSTILCMSVSLSGTVTLACLFLPKIYVVLFQPEKNVRYGSSGGNTGTGGTCNSSQGVRFLRTAPTISSNQQISPRILSSEERVKPNASKDT